MDPVAVLMTGSAGNLVGAITSFFSVSAYQSSIESVSRSHTLSTPSRVLRMQELAIITSFTGFVYGLKVLSHTPPLHQCRPSYPTDPWEGLEAYPRICHLTQSVLLSTRISSRTRSSPRRSRRTTPGS